MKLLKTLAVITLSTAFSFGQAEIKKGEAISIGSGSEKITFKGSDTIGAKMAPQLAETYVALGNAVKFDIAAEGSSVAFKALLDGTASIGMSSRAAKEEEKNNFIAKGQELNEIVAGVDMISVIVNNANGIKNLTKDQIKGIFTGTIKDWAEVGGNPGTISIYTRNETSGTYKTFQKLAMDKTDYASNSQKQAGNTQIVEQVSKNVNGIGYVGLAYAESEGVSSINVDGIECSPENAEKYALARNLYYYTIGEPTGETKKFLDWATSNKTAAAIIKKVGFIPSAK